MEPERADEVQRQIEVATEQAAGNWRIFDSEEGVERVQAAIVLWAQGDLARVRNAIELLGRDWRDALVRGALAEPSWPERLEKELGQPK